MRDLQAMLIPTDLDEVLVEAAMDAALVESDAMRQAADRGIPLADFEDENGQLER